MTDKVETLWEMQDKDLFAESFTTHKGTFLCINKKNGVVTLTVEEALMILRTFENYEKNKDN